jgi:YcaO-like protein with predicted kinase domain
VSSPAPSSRSWCRALSLERTASILESSASLFGVTRVGSITRLDGIGIATVSTVRGDPIGESISVSTGKGASELQARVGALAEALERYCAEPRGRIAIPSARAVELDGACLAPEALILPEGVEAGGNVNWCRGRTLDGASVWIPANAVFFPFFPSAGAARLFAANTTGLAVGSSVDEALVFALLECIERDAYSRAVALATVGRGDDVPVVDLKSVREFAGAELEGILRRGHDVLVRDLRCDTDVPCYLCTLHDGVLAHFGTAARLDAGEAVRAALQEAAQSRLTDLQGAREDLADRSTSNMGGVDPWFLSGGNAEVVAVSGDWCGDSVGDALEELRGRLNAVTLPAPVAWIELSLSQVALTVVRAVTPGLEVWAFDPSRLGPRARGWLCLPA